MSNNNRVVFKLENFIDRFKPVATDGSIATKISVDLSTFIRPEMPKINNSILKVRGEVGLKNVWTVVENKEGVQFILSGVSRPYGLMGYMVTKEPHFGRVATPLSDQFVRVLNKIYKYEEVEKKFKKKFLKGIPLTFKNQQIVDKYLQLHPSFSVEKQKFSIIELFKSMFKMLRPGDDLVNASNHIRLM